MYTLSPVTPRVQRIRKRYRSTQPKVCTARLSIVTDFYRSNPQLTGVLKRAKNFKNLCEKMPVLVSEDELIVGSLASTFRGSAMYPENDLHWFVEDYRAGLVPNRSLDPYLIDPADIEVILDAAEFWEKESLSAKVDEYIPEGYFPRAANNVTIFRDKHICGTPVGHFCANYETVMRQGYGGIRAEARAKMAGLEGAAFGDDIAKYHFYRAVTIVCDGMELLANRYADECERLAALEPALERKEELLGMADCLRHIAEKPCRGYQDAVQSMFLYHLGLCLDANMHGLSFGRVDQYLGPYYEADITAGRITHEKAQELLDLFFLKVAEFNKFWAAALTHAIAGYTSGCLMTLGGVKRDGSDATNPVTYMMLQSAGRLVLHDPPLDLRIHQGTPDALWEAALETTKIAGGVPAFENDDVIIPALLDRGMTQEDANNYSLIGCVEPAGTGNSWPACCGTGGEGYWNMANAFLHAINNGYNPMPNPDGSARPQTGLPTGYLYEMKTFEDVREAVRRQFRYFIDWQVSMTNSFEYVAAEQMPQPLASATIDGCMASGTDVMKGGAQYNSTGFPGVGIGTVADCLAAVKYLVYDKKLVSARELYDALMADWEGHEDLRQLILHEAPHYGNNNEYADEQAAWVAGLFADLVGARTGPRGAYTAGLYPITFHVVYGKDTAATPDGRRAGEPLSDGISSVQTLDKNGPTASILSAAKLGQRKFSNGTLMNMKFHPTALQSESGKAKLIALMKTYFALGGMELQFNIVSAETLRAAQAHPEDYQDLVVRIAGFSAYFVEIYKECQDDIIRRTELCLR